VLRAFRDDARELARAMCGSTDRRALLRAVLTCDSYLILALWRVRTWALRWRVPGLNHVLRRVQTVFFGIELGKEIRLGRGVFFVHPIGITVGGDSRVGDRVRFMGNNTVGTARGAGHPVIEDDVLLGAGARVLGAVRVGARAVIGANAVVLTDVPADSVAVGLPAKVVGGRDARAEAEAGGA
jgi:serine O-acetyltransferase